MNKKKKLNKILERINALEAEVQMMGYNFAQEEDEAAIEAARFNREMEDLSENNGPEEEDILFAGLPLPVTNIGVCDICSVSKGRRSRPEPTVANEAVVLLGESLVQEILHLMCFDCQGAPEGTEDRIRIALMTAKRGHTA